MYASRLLSAYGQPLVCLCLTLFKALHENTVCRLLLWTWVAAHRAMCDESCAASLDMREHGVALHMTSWLPCVPLM